MTATQAPPVDASEVVGVPAPGLAGVLSSADHKIVGRLYIGTALLFGLASAVAGILVGIDRIDGVMGNTILAVDTAPQVASFHRLSLPLLFAIPALLGLAMVVVPLQVGARAIAFPRAAAASFWGFLLGAAAFAASYALNGGPGGGRTDAVDLWTTATVMVVASLLLGSLCVATTVLAARTRGMTLDRVPLFAWSLMCTTAVWMLTLPVAVAIMLLAYVDHRFGHVFFGESSVPLDAHLYWLIRQPQVYTLAIPLLGLAFDTAATAAGVRLPKRGVAMSLVGVYAVLGIGAFALPTLVPAAADQPVTKAMAVLVILPVLGALALVGLTLKSGTPKVTSGLIASVVGLLILLVATLGGAALQFQSLLELQETQWESAHSHLVLAAAVLGLVGGLYHWSTKLFGYRAGDVLGRVAPVLLGFGALVVAIPEGLSALIGEGDEVVSGIEAMNGVSVAGAVLVMLGALAAVVGLIGRPGADEPADPWGGQTLEWATPSPPPFDNFEGAVPAVTSAEPLLDGQNEEAEA